MEYFLFHREYYFSIDNLLHDVFLRQQMDAEGWISLEIIAGFHRINALSNNLDLIIEVTNDLL